MKNAWFKAHLTDGRSNVPFTFAYDGRPSASLLSKWPVDVAVERLGADRTRRTLTWTDPKTGLEVRCIAVDYADYPAVEWTVWFKNTGANDTPILEDIQGLDVQFERDAKDDEFVLNGIKGDFESAEGYEPYRRVLSADSAAHFAPPGCSGKSCDGPDGWPYFNLQTPSGGVIIAVGWPGQWAAAFTCDSDTGLTVRAGQQLTRLYLEPGEQIRTPLIALLFWQGNDVVEAQNLWRRWYRAHNLPRIGGQPQPPTTIVTVLGDDAERGELQALVDGGVPIDILWRDAGGTRQTVWFQAGDGPFHEPGMVWLNSGTCEIDRQWNQGDTVRVDFDFRPHYWVQEAVTDSDARHASIYRGPLLLAYDPHHQSDDPVALPILSATDLKLRRVTDRRWLPPCLLLETKATDGTRVRLCDFASAGMAGTAYETWLPVQDALSPVPFAKENPLRSQRDRPIKED